MSEPYKEVKAGDPILAKDWNSIQSLIREHILTHTHGGGDSGAEIDVDLRSLALGAELAVRKLEASDSLLVGPSSQPVLAVNPKATNMEGSYQVSVAGTLRAEQVRTARLDGVTSLAAGDLAVSGSVGIGTAAGGGYRLSIAGGDAYLGGALAVAGPAHLGGGLNVGGPTVLNGPLTTGPLAAESLQILGPVAAVGAASLSGGLSVTGTASLGGDLNVTGGTTLSGDASIGTGKLLFGAQTRQMINLWRESYGIGVQNNTLYFRTGAHVAWYKQGAHDNGEFSAGTGGTPLMVIRDGNVAIGTADPGGNRLRVQGGATYLEGGLTVTGPSTLNGGLTVNGLATTATLRVGGGTTIDRFDDGALSNVTTSVPTARAVKAYIDAQVTQLNSQLSQATSLITQLTGQLNQFRAIYDRHQHRYIHYTYRDITTVNVQNWGDTQPPNPA